MGQAKQTREDSQFSDLWDQAIKEHNGNVPEAQRINVKDSKWLQIEGYEGLVKTIRKTHDDFHEERHSSFTKVLKRFCTGVSALTDLAGGAASLAFPPCSQILGAVSVLIGAGKKVTGAFDAVEGLFQRLDNFMQRLKALTEHGLDPDLRNNVISLLVALLALCNLATRRVCLDEHKDADWAERHPRLARFMRSTKSKTKEYFTQLFKGEDDEINASVANIERLVDAESRMTLALVKRDTSKISEQVDGVTVDIHGLSLKIYDVKYEIQRNAEGVAIGFAEIKAQIGHLQETVISGQAVSNAYNEKQLTALSTSDQHLRDIKADMQSLLLAQSVQKPANPDITKARKHAKLINTLLKPSSPNHGAFQMAKAERQALGTCNWILQNQFVKRWLSREIPILLVEGDRGTGKTFLAARIIEELQRQFDSPDDDGLSSFAYFFCKTNSDELSSISVMLKSLASQICEADKKYTTHLDTAAKRERIVLARDDIGELWNVLFQEFYQEFDSHTAIVIDGTNETILEELYTFIDVLSRSIGVDSSSRPDSIHILLLTDTAASDKWKKAFGESVPVVTLSATDNQADLRQSVQRKLDQEWKGIPVSKALRSEVENTLLAGCQGNFLWLSLVLKSVLSRQREDAIWALLSNLPKDVSGAVTLILDRLTRKLDIFERQDLCDVVAWVACSPLAPSIADLDALLAMRNPRNPGRPRVINLERLICEDWSALFVVSRAPVLAVYKERMMQQDLDEDISSVPDIKQKTGTTINTGVESAGAKPSRGRTVGQLKDPERGAKSRLSNTRVRLAGDIVEHFKSSAQDTPIHHNMPELSMFSMRVTVLIFTLEVMYTNPRIQPALFAIAHRNCALWLPHYLCGIDVSKVSLTDRQIVVWYLVRILRDRRIIQTWLADEQVRTSINYHLLLCPDVQRQLLLWFQSPSALSYLSRADQDWVQEAIRDPFQHLFREIALCNAHRWLLIERLESAPPNTEMALNYEFVNTYLEKTNSTGQVQGSHSIHKVNHIRTAEGKDAIGTFIDHDVESDSSIKDYSLEASSADRILKVARWLKLEEGRHWNCQVARALVLAGRLEEGLRYHKRAHELDPSDARVAYLVAGCHWALADAEDDSAKSLALRRSGLPFLEKARHLFANRAASEASSKSQKSDARVGYYDCLNKFASQYRSLNKDQEELAVHEELLRVWEETEEEFLTLLVNVGISVHLDDLAEKERYDQFGEILARAVQHPKIDQFPFIPIYSQMLQRGKSILAFAHKAKQLDLAIRFWENGKQLIAEYGPPGETAALRWHHATLLLRLAPDKTSEALRMLQGVVRDPEIATLANEWNDLKPLAEFELARYYLDRALAAIDQDRWDEAGQHAHKLTVLSQESADKASESLQFLAVWYRLNGRLPHAKRCVREQVQQALDMLYDDDEENDEWAWWSLCFAVTVVGDEQRAKTAHGMLGSLAVYGNDMELVDFNEWSGSEAQDTGTATEHLDDPRSPILESEVAGGNTNSTDSSSPAALTSTSDVDITKDGSTVEQNTSETAGSELETQSADATDGEISLYICDGPCLQQILWSKTAYRCNYCVVTLCQTCHDLVKEGKNTGFAVCGMTHEFFEFPPIEQYPPKKLKVGDELVLIQDWLDALADEYGVSRRSLVE